MLSQLWIRDTQAVLSKRHLVVDGVGRTYYYYAPSYLRSARKPMVFAFHGGEGDGLHMARQTAFTRLAAREGFAVVFPDARDYWRDGRTVAGTDDNDLHFVQALIDELVASEGADPQRIYATGASNGGMFTLRLACEMSTKIAAFAPVLASFPVEYWPRCKPARPVPILMINATDDTLIPWEGGQIRRGRVYGLGGEVIPVAQTVEFWRRHNGCNDKPVIRTLKPRRAKDPTRVKVLSFTGCQTQAPVELIRIEGGGHTWPDSQEKRAGPLRRKIMGRVSRNLNATAEVWHFCRNHTLPPELAMQPQQVQGMEQRYLGPAHSNTTN